jgi:hypothetical protein
MGTASAVLSLRLPLTEKTRLEKLARRAGRSVGELAARMVIEGRRREDFPYIDFRETAAGRMAYLQGFRVPIWWLARLARKSKAQAIAQSLKLPLAQVQAGLNYAAAFPEEIDNAILDYEETSLEDLKRELPGLEVFDAGENLSGKRRQ